MTVKDDRLRRDRVEYPLQLRALKRTEILDRWLPPIVDAVLEIPEIADGVTQAGLDRGTLRTQVLDARQEILAPADADLESTVTAALKVSSPVTPTEPLPNRVGGITMMLLGGVAVVGPVLLLVLFWTDLAWWLAVPCIVAALVVGFFGIVFFNVGVDDFRGKPSTPRLVASSALARWSRVCQEEGVLPYVRRIVDEHLEPINRGQLTVTIADAPGLLGTSESTYMVRTGSVNAFLATAARLPTGAIGLAGPRGVGKTSLIEYFAGHGSRRALKVTVSAPIQYEPRDFVLHLFASVCLAMLRTRPQRRWRRQDAVAALTHQHLRNIQYLQTHTSGWSGKVTLAGSSEAGWSRQTQRERRPQTYPELVGALRDLLAAFAQSEGVSPAVIIAIDELDKIESADDAQRFVNGIKGIFGAPGTQFLVSVSEDALASFERRGLPVRDAFDSAFHEIVRVDYLTLGDTAELLSSRVLRLPEPFKWLVHCMSGGLPRDVVRTARAMVALTSQDEPPPSLDEVCAALVADDLARKSHAFQLACRDIGDSPEVTEFIRSLRKLRADERFLLTLLPHLRKDGELATLSRQAAAFVYYLATLLEVFRRDKVDSHGKDTFELLARARQSLAVHPRLTWLQVDEFRESWELTTVPAD